MTELQFRKLLQEAMEEAYGWIPDPEDLNYDYTFSPEFDAKMEQMLRENGINIKLKPVSKSRTCFGGHTFRRAAVVILAAVLVLALAACTVYYLRVHWNETQNDVQGTLDITFDVERAGNTSTEFEAKRPQTPEGFTVVEEKVYTTSLEIEYRDNAHVIYYDQTGGIEAMGLSIDSEDNDLQKIVINGHKGYISQKRESSHLIWTDGISCFELIGNVDKYVLEEIAETVG